MAPGEVQPWAAVAGTRPLAALQQWLGSWPCPLSYEDNAGSQRGDTLPTAGHPVTGGRTQASLRPPHYIPIYGSINVQGFHCCQ